MADFVDVNGPWNRSFRVGMLLDLPPMRVEVLRRRFIRKYSIDGECWIWGAYCMPNGYGVFYLRGGCPVLAHRFSYELHIAPIPHDRDVDHLCRVRNCVNPQHLEPVTRAENLRRGVRPIGERNGQSKLTTSDVQKIKQRVVSGKRGIRTQLATEYGVCKQTITLIAQGRNWAHVE